jgi:predicted DNA-binding protein YlxM (UPF0122 family)
MSLFNEVPIKGFEGKYTISNYGQIFSIKSQQYLKCGICTSGYPIAKLFISYDSVTNKRLYKYVRVHRLVAEHFLDNLENKPCINHKDGNKLNNLVQNLEYCSHKENSLHAFTTGLTPKKQRKLTPEQIQECVQQYKSGITIKEMTHKFNVSRNAIEKYVLKAEDLQNARQLQLQLRGKNTGKQLSISVQQYTKEGVFIKSWESMIKAAKSLGVNPGNISNVISGRQKSAGGFLWKR